MEESLDPLGYMSEAHWPAKPVKQQKIAPVNAKARKAWCLWMLARLEAHRVWRSRLTSKTTMPGDQAPHGA